MKSKEVLRLLKITRQTLTKYVKNGLIKVYKVSNGRKQKKDLGNQVNLLKNYCFQNGMLITFTKILHLEFRLKKEKIFFLYLFQQKEKND